MSACYDVLVAKGPLPRSDLPSNPTLKDRREGVSTFQPTLCVNPTGSYRAGSLAAVVYILDVHEQEDVIHVWLELNRKALEDVPVQPISLAVGSYGRSWGEAMTSVREHLSWL